MNGQITVVHANDPTTQFLSNLYKSRTDVISHITETSSNVDVIRAIREGDTIMMLGHGNQYGLFSKPDKNGKYERFLITDRHVQFLRDKTCIGIWCHANLFAEKYRLHGLFSGMIISDLQEASDYHISATKEEIDMEMETFALRLKEYIEMYDLSEIPQIMTDSDYHKTELNKFNYGNLFYY